MSADDPRSADERDASKLVFFCVPCAWLHGLWFLSGLHICSKSQSSEMEKNAFTCPLKWPISPSPNTLIRFALHRLRELALQPQRMHASPLFFNWVNNPNMVIPQPAHRIAVQHKGRITFLTACCVPFPHVTLHYLKADNLTILPVSYEIPVHGGKWQIWSPAGELRYKTWQEWTFFPQCRTGRGTTRILNKCTEFPRWRAILEDCIVNHNKQSNIITNHENHKQN